MENNNQGSNQIVCPQITCGIILGLNTVSFILSLNSTNGSGLVLNLAIIITYGIIFFLILKAIKERAYNYYNIGFIISIVLSGVLTFLRIIVILFLATAKTSSSSQDQQKMSLLIGNIVQIFFDWIEACVLMCYKEKVKNLCEPPDLDYQNPETDNGPLV